MNSAILKWVGGKTKVMAQLRPHLPVGDRLVEPFAGSCAVMMNTDYPAYLIADINPDLINMYQQIQQLEKPFLAMAAKLFATHSTEADYKAIRSEFNDLASLPLLERAVYFLYLNRHCYRGVCRYNLSGGFNVPFEKQARPRFPQEEIQAFALKAQRAEFIVAGYAETLARVRPGDVIYADPPYHQTFTKYHAGDFTEQDQSLLAARLSELAADGYPVIASNSDTPFIHGVYGHFTRHIISTSRSIQVKAGAGKQALEIVACGGAL